MLIMYEYAACVLAALIFGTLLFAAGAMCVMLWAAGGIAWRWWREWAFIPSGLVGRLAPEPRVP
jgi:hypothetical protein